MAGYHYLIHYKATGYRRGDFQEMSGNVTDYIAGKAIDSGPDVEAVMGDIKRLLLSIDFTADDVCITFLYLLRVEGE